MSIRQPIPHRMVEKYGVAAAVALQTFLICLVSVLATYLVMFVVGMQEMLVPLMLSFVCPALIAPPVTYSFLKVHGQMIEKSAQLEAILSEVKELKGLLPICASCKSIRDDQGYWKQIEAYISERSKAEFTHSICPDCNDALYGEFLSK